MKERIKFLVEQLNKANDVYYRENKEIMSNLEYDRLYDELVKLETETGIVYAESPTQGLGNHVYESLPKVQHETPMLSLDKTKDPNRLCDTRRRNHQGVLSWKLDGLTVVLTYENGKLQKAVTRGNGYIGEEVTENAKRAKNIPLQIPFKGKLVLRGEAVISYKDFEEINSRSSLSYKNPRNLASATLRSLSAVEVTQRHLQVVIFEVITDIPGCTTVEDKFQWISKLGFTPVEHKIVSCDDIPKTVLEFEKEIENNPLPSDGLVFTYNDIEYGRSLGSTAKFPRHSKAFKWKDEMAETILRNVEWDTSRTGIINPVAVFDPVDLEGTEVSRATLNNVGFIKDMQLGIGDRIQVYKANMIIPQVEQSLDKGNNVPIPDKCPDCGGSTSIKDDILYCDNPECPAKLLNQLVHFCSRDAMNIRGVSKKNLEFLINQGWVDKKSDLFMLDQYARKWMMIKGYSKVSVDKILAAINESKNVSSENFLYALGISMIGRTQAKTIMNKFQNWDNFYQAVEDRYDFSSLEGIGEKRTENLYAWMKKNAEEAKTLSGMMNFKNVASTTEKKLSGKVFCITGKVSVGRAALTKQIEDLGGTVTGTVTSKTSYLINNDTESESSKNRKAKDLGISIISEEEFSLLL